MDPQRSRATATHRFIRRLIACLAIAAPLLADEVDDRARALIAQMTLAEKVSQFGHESPAIERLGIPAYNWWNEALHGVARSGRATVFPQAIGLAATWDVDLMARVAAAISDEARAKHHEYVRQGRRGIYQGLTFFSPNINLFRDPRWGRGMETYGEDPLLTGRMATAFIQGMQGDDPVYLKTAATAKHFAVHSGPESLRHGFDARVSEQDLRASYLPQFELAVREGRVESVMCAYNAVNGVPACANSDLLDTRLRKEWGFGGYVVSDCWAITDIQQGHGYAKTPEEAAAAALRAGTDLACGPEYGNLLAAFQQGLVSESDIDRALARLLRVRLRLFDEANPYRNISMDVLDSTKHRELALEAARKSLVLLRNEGNALPLPRSIGSLAVIGPNADDRSILLGNYNGYPSMAVTPLAALRDRVPVVHYAKGSGLTDGVPALETFPFPLTGRYYASHEFGDDDAPEFEVADEIVDFDWWSGSPGVRWAGWFTAPESGRFYLGAEGQNAFELYLDGRLIATTYHITERGLGYAPVDLEAGREYEIQLDFHAFENDASIRLLWSKPEERRLEEAVEVARKSDTVVMFLGLSPRLEGEEMEVSAPGYAGGDRTDLELPAMQQRLLEAVVATGKPVVLVLLNGSALAVNWAQQHVPAIVEAWYPGQAAGSAIADVLFGDYNPSGRLPVTFYRSVEDLPPFEDYSMAGRTHRYFEGTPLYPFGHGLSYTTFEESTPVFDGDRIRVMVRNTGTRAGEHVVAVYSQVAPRELIAFGKVALEPGESKTVTLVQYHRNSK